MEYPEFVTVKQSEIEKLKKKIEDYGKYCNSMQRCFDNKCRDLRFTIKDKNYQIEILKERVNRCKEELIQKNKEIKQREMELERKIQTIKRQKMDIAELQLAFNHLYGDALNSSDHDFRMEQDVDEDVIEAGDQDVDEEVTENVNEDVDLNTSNES